MLKMIKSVTVNERLSSVMVVFAERESRGGGMRPGTQRQVSFPRMEFEHALRSAEFVVPWDTATRLTEERVETVHALLCPGGDAHVPGACEPFTAVLNALRGRP